MREGIEGTAGDKKADEISLMTMPNTVDNLLHGVDDHAGYCR